MTSRRSVLDVTRALGALVVLLGHLAGIPATLLVVAPLTVPNRAPTWAEVTGVLTRPDDGHIFLAALAVIAWAAWAAFSLSVLVEAIAILRGLPAPRLPLLAVPQRGAATLVAAVAVLLGPANPAAIPTGRPHPVAASAHDQPVPVAEVVATFRASATATTDRGPTRPVEAASSGSSHVEHQTRPVHPTVMVHRGDTLWSLAERHLGAGIRFAEIAELNYGRPQRDGRQLTSAHWIYPGWTLRLPSDAMGHATAPKAGDPYVVQRGDTLSEIAETLLGDADRYPEIAALNAGDRQSDGATLTDPDVIHPGWTLDLPAADPVPQPPPTPPKVSQPPATPRSSPPSISAPAGPASSAPTPSAPRYSPSPEAAPPTVAPSNVESPTVADGDQWSINALVLGLGALATTGVIGELAIRRRRQQRHRRAGERIPLPDPDVADVERTLRSAEDPVTLDIVRSALRDLSRACSVAGRELPRLAALLVSPQRLDLLLTEEDDAPVDPFSSVAARTWRLTRTPEVSLTQDEDVPEPYPALLTLGVTEDALLLVNVEAAGTLTVTGSDHQAAAVLRALAVELVTNPLTESAAITLGPELADLSAVTDVVRARTLESPEDAARHVAAHQGALSTIWADAGVDDVRQARSRGVATDTWAPEIHLRAGADFAPSPWSGVALITSAAGELPGPGWSLDVADGGSAHFRPLDLDVDPQRLEPTTYAQLLELLATADRTATCTTTAGGPTNSEVADVLASLPSPLERAPTAEMLPAPTASLAPTAPRLLLLGPVVVEGADDQAVPNRRRQLTELVAYLALHPGPTYHQLDEAMWPGKRVGNGTRNALTSRTRRWLGHTPSGQPYLPTFTDTGDYHLHQAVRCDWDDFTGLARQGLAAAGPEGAADLTAALALVRGRPFVGVDPRRYTWAEADLQQMISAIVDVAHVLAGMRLAAGDHRGAQEAAATGLLAEPCSEVLYRDAIRAAAMRGDLEEVHRLADRLHAQIERIDPDADPDDDTIELLSVVGHCRAD